MPARRRTRRSFALPATTTIGNIAIQRIVEQEGPFFDALQFFPKLTRELLDQNRSWLQPKFLDPAGKLLLCIQSYLVRTPHHNILIDTCVGNHKPRPTRPFWHMMASDRYEQSLAETGLRVEDIDYVMCTHLHTDHVGWNTRLDNGRWVPTFPKARYVFADRELDFWTKRQKQDPASCPWVEDSVLPIVAANRVDIVSSAHELNDLVTLIPTPGHTIDHYSVQVGKPGADAIIAGDMIHSPLQARYPELGMMVDYDSGLAGQSRRKLFGRICDTSTLICTAHFPSPSTGRVVGLGDAFDIVTV
jgi:glyoxylase-like metal-dependent hydrolase (beta-lactamase superfamily II)